MVFLQKLQKKLKAFTLVEVLVYTFLLSVISVGVSGILFQLYRIQSVVDDRATITENLRQLHKSIRDDMYVSDDLFVDSNGDLVLTSTFSTPATVRYSLVSGAVYRTADSGTAIRVTDSKTDVFQFNVTDISSASAAEVVNVDIGLRNFDRGTLKPPVSLSLSTTVGIKFVV